jgi:8-oxo-dGTP pyrophosphatase MutT (NUDIX family)
MREAGVMLVVNPEGLILGITRRNDRTKYGLPGGKLDPTAGDKNAMDAAIRETLEETGIVVTSCLEIYKRVELGDGVNAEDFYSTCFYAAHWEGLPRDSEEGSVKWLTPEEVTCSKAAFGAYNRKTLDIFKTMFPNVKLEGE